MDPHKFHGKDIPHIKLDPKMTIEDLVDVFASTGFNGRQLGEAAKLLIRAEKFAREKHRNQKNRKYNLTVKGWFKFMHYYN